MITADHGNDPAHAEHRPLAGARAAAGRMARGIAAASTWARETTFADLGQTLAEVFGLAPLAHGTSFLKEIVRDHS